MGTHLDGTDCTCSQSSRVRSESRIEMGPISSVRRKELRMLMKRWTFGDSSVREAEWKAWARVGVGAVEGWL